jgi:hypothetical protein
MCLHESTCCRISSPDDDCGEIEGVEGVEGVKGGEVGE